MENIGRAKKFYDQGLRFLRCTERCIGDVNDDSSIQIVGGKNMPLSTPSMVNAAFSCEMFLKAILIAHGIDYMRLLKHGEGHRLKPLFDLLPDQEYKDYLRIGTEEEFNAELEEHSGDFENWRYYMETPGEYRMCPDFTTILMYNLKTLAKAVIQKEEML